MSTLSVDTIQGKTTAGTVAMPTGSLMQVVQTHVTANTTTSSSSMVTTGLEVTITPKFSTSKILITGNVAAIYSNGATKYAKFELFKGSSFLAYITALAAYLQNEIAYNTDISFSYLDSPSTTSATTYKLMWNANNSGVMWFNNYGSSNNTTRSTITAMEIAG